MAKVAVFLPGSISEETVRQQIQSYPNIEPVFIGQIPNASVQEYAERLVQQGCEIFVARGLQALILEKETQSPVVPLRITAQELGMLIQTIRADYGRDDIRIGLVGYSNMFCDVSHFRELFGVEIRKYIMQDWSTPELILEKTQQDGMEVIIGGRHICEAARKNGIPAYFASGGTEGLSETFGMAQQMCELADTKKQDLAEITAMVENNFNGILHISREHVILSANRVMLSILEADAQDIIGRRISDVVGVIREADLIETIDKGSEIYSRMILLNNVGYFVNIAPIEVDHHISGAILTFQEARRIHELDQEMRRDLLTRGYYASRTFDSFHWKSKQMDEIVKKAKLVAPLQAPVLLTGERGLEKTVIAECIHNESLVRDNTFVEVECSAYKPDDLDERIFGRSGQSVHDGTSLIEIAQEGTLYLKNVECLSMESQYKLHALLAGKFIAGNASRYSTMETRVIASTEIDLLDRVEKGLFRSDLYFELSVVKLDLEPLYRRREDIPVYAHEFMTDMQKKYNRPVRLTRAAEKVLTEYEWPGNTQQLNNVCQRIVLLSPRRDADENFVTEQIALSYPLASSRTEPVPDGEFADARTRINRLLEKHHGSREKVAKELGVSKTTLWRYMKKYGLEQ